MAKYTEDYNTNVVERLRSIDDDRLLKISNDIANFTKNYNSYIKSSKQDEINKDLKEVVKIGKESSKNYKEINKKLYDGTTKTTETLKKINNEIVDSKIENSKTLEKLSSASEKSIKQSETLNKLTSEIYKENKQEKLQSLIRDSKRFRLESKYWKSLTGGIKGMASEFHDFKNNPSRWMSEAMGDLLGNALDKAIDGLKDTLDAGIKSITQGLSGIKDSIFDMLSDQKKRAEDLAQEFNRSYMETSGILNKSNAAVSMLAQSGELDISRTSKNIEVITSKMLRRFGDDLEKMDAETYNKHFKAYAQLINAGASDKIDEIEEIAAGNERLFEDMIKTETQLSGIRSRQDLRIQKGMDAAIITAEEAHRLGISYEQSLRANEKNQIFIAKVLASNKELGVDEVKAFVDLQKALMSQDFVTNILDDKNINLSQLIGIDSNNAKKILTSGSDKERLDFINRIVKSGAYNEIPALKSMMENLGFNAQSLNILSKQGELKIKDESIKKITDAQKTDFSLFNEVLLSSGSKINEEIRTRLSLLSSEGLRDERGRLRDEAKGQIEALRQINTIEQLISENEISKTEADVKKANELYKLVSDYAKGNQLAIEKFMNLSESDREFAEKILITSEKKESLVNDQLQVATTLSEAQDLGLGKALSGGGLQGLFSGLLDVGLKSAYSPEYQEKIASFMDNIKKAIEPAVNIFKEMLIDPILDSLNDVIGGLLGDILVAVKGLSPFSEYTEEEKEYDRLKFTTTEERVLKDIEKLKIGRVVGSEDYEKILKDIGNYSIEDIRKNKNLSLKERNNLLFYKSKSFLEYDRNQLENLSPEEIKALSMEFGIFSGMSFKKPKDIITGSSYENGGVIAHTAGGKQVTVGEAGYDEIIIPTDPAKQKRAQELLNIAQEKYGIYANNPNEMDVKLKEQISDLLFDLRVLMLQVDPKHDIFAMQNIMSAFNILKGIGNISSSDSFNETEAEELIGGGFPVVGRPIENAPSIDSIRKAIIDEAKKYTGTKYAVSPAGLVCNELVNVAYGGVLGKKNYKELLNSVGYNYPQMWTISGFINIMGKKGFHGLMASHVPYSDLTSKAKMADLVFSSPNKTVEATTYNPDRFGHVSMYIDSESKIDSTSMKINGKDGVGVHKPSTGPVMLMNILDLMPESWYMSKGLLKQQGVESKELGMSIVYDPALQDTPNATYVSDQISRKNQAEIEKEKKRVESQDKASKKVVKEIIKIFGIEKYMNNNQKNVNFSVPKDKSFCSSGMMSCNVTSYQTGR